MEEIGFGLQLGAQPLHELPVLLGVLALDHHHQVVLRRELLLEPEEVLMVLLVGAHQVVAARVEFDPGYLTAYEDAERQTSTNCAIEEQPPMPQDQARQPGQESRDEAVGR